MKDKILIIDIETTNFLDQGGKIVEVGIVELDVKSGEKKIIFDKVCHERPITKEEVESSWIVTNGFMTVDEIQKSKTLESMRDEIQEILNKYDLGATAYNNIFDFGFLESRGFVFPKKLPCPMLLSTNICKIAGKYGKYKWPSVPEAYDFYFPNNDYQEIHRGADDAFNEADIVYELLLRGVFKLK